MSSEQVDKFMEKFDEVDEKKKGSLDKTQFTTLFKQVMGGEVTDEMAEIYFNGIDIDGSKSIGRDEFEAFVKAALEKDQEYTIKMAFRAFDKDRSKSLDCKEVQSIAKYCGKEMSDDEVKAAMKKQTGKESGKMTYAMIVKVITGKDIDAKADPYDGKLKSKCCLLL